MEDELQFAKKFETVSFSSFSWTSFF